MKMNMALWDRILRFIFGVILTSWALSGGPWWGYVGIYMILSSGWGLCLAYSFFKIRTLKDTERPIAPSE